MRTSLISASLALSVGVNAYPQKLPNVNNIIGNVIGDVKDIVDKVLAPALALEEFIKTPKFAHPLSLAEARSKAQAGTPPNNNTPPSLGSAKTEKVEESKFTVAAVNDEMSAQATCSNPRVRQEWDSYSDSDRQAYLSAIKCLQSRPPNGQFSQSKSRYEDLVALHQTLTPNVHGSAKFLIWHRYYLFTFEDILRSECGFDRNLPWWDETRYSGHFADSSIFSDQWYGGINAGGNCITNGVSNHDSR